MAQRDVAINLLTKLQDKGFKDLEKSTKKSDKTLQKFGKRLTAVFGTTIISRFVAKSIKAFSENEKALRRLTVELENVNLGFASPLANDFIRNLSLATGIADDDLNPALQRLVRSTYTLTDAQKLLTLAVDISKRTGKDLSSVSIALERAYLGQTTSLSKLNIGYTTATLKGKDFDVILADLQKRYSGGALATQNDFATSLDRLKVGFDEAQEAIGEGFVKGLEKSGKSIQEFQRDLIKTGEQLGVLLSNITGIIDKFSFLITTFDLFRKKTDDFEASQRASDKAIRDGIVSDFERLGLLTELAKQEALNAKIRAQQLAKIKAQEKKDAATNKRTAEIERLRSAITYKFDLEAINQQAALRRQISQSDKDRLLQLIALKVSDYQEDEDAIKTLQAATQGRYNEAMALEQMFALLKAAGFAADKKAIEDLSKLNPKITVTDNLNDFIARLKALLEGKYSINIGVNGLGVTGGTTAGGTTGGGTTGGGFLPGGTGEAGTGTGGSIGITPVVTSSGNKGIFDTITAIVKNQTTLVDDFLAALPSGLGANDLATARYELQARQITAQNQLTNALSGARYQAMANDITSQNTMTNQLAADRYTAMQNFYTGRGNEGVTVNVNVSGSVIAQTDLVAAVTDAVYQSQRTGNPLLLESI